MELNFLTAQTVIENGRVSLCVCVCVWAVHLGRYTFIDDLPKEQGTAVPFATQASLSLFWRNVPHLRWSSLILRSSWRNDQKRGALKRRHDMRSPMSATGNRVLVGTRWTNQFGSAARSQSSGALKAILSIRLRPGFLPIFRFTSKHRA